MRINDETFDNVLNNDAYTLDERVEVACEFLYDIAGSNEYVKSITTRVLHFIPLQDICRTWDLVRGDLDFYQSNHGEHRDLWDNTTAQNALWWIKNNRYELRDLYYFYSGWFTVASHDLKMDKHLGIEAITFMFDVMQSIWTNSCHGWWSPIEQDSTKGQWL